MRKPLLYAILIFTIAFWLWRLPFLLWVPVPGIGADTFKYFDAVKYFVDGSAFAGDNIGLPLGFPVFCYIVNIFVDRLSAIIFLQFFLHFISGIFLIYIIWKYYGWVCIAAGAALAIFSTDTFSLRLDTTLGPDSLYCSFLILTAACLIDTIKWVRIKKVLFFSLILFLVAFTRSNGIYIYFLIPLLFLVFFLEKKSISHYLMLLLPVVCLHALMLVLKNQSNFFSNSANRFSNVIERETDALDGEKKSYFQKKKQIAFRYLTMQDFPSFYFSILPAAYEEIYPGSFENFKNQNPNWILTIPEEQRKFVLKEYFHEPQKLKENEEKMNVSESRKNPLFFVIHVFYRIQNVIFRNIFWNIIALILLAAATYFLIKTKTKNKESILLITLCLIHLLSVFVITVGHDVLQLRYAHVSEFILYLVPLFGFILLMPHYKLKYAEQ